MGWGALVVLSISWFGIGHASEVYLGLSRSTGAKIPIGILGVQAAPELGDSAATLRSIIESDLRRSQLFELVPLSGPVPAGPPDAGRIKQAASGGVDAVVWGRLTRERDGGLLWEGSGYDGGNGAIVVQKWYRGQDEPAYLRSMEIGRAHV